jgi:polyhydroxyalkanoate synthase
MISQDSQTFNIPAFFSGLLRINKKITENYFKNKSGYHTDYHDIILSYSSFINKILTDPNEMQKLQKRSWEVYLNQMEILKRIFFDPLLGKTNVPVILPEIKDKRFLAEEWNQYPYFNFLEQNFLLFEKFWDQTIDEVEIDTKERKKLEFFTDQYVDLFCPSNFIMTNPEVLKLAFETNGESLWKGFNNLVNDIENGKIAQTDESAFEVGKNLAVTPGAVIFENELIQLIQYTPVTEKVYETPLLIVPPWINKYYVLDLQENNSFVKYFIEQGFTVYIISWKNPKPGMGYLSMDDYVEEGVLKAIEVAENISYSNKINVLGYCIGGTLLSIATSILSSREKPNPINFVTFLASMIDFSDVGPMGNVINEALVRKLENGELLNDGVLHGYDMERAFNLIRANDLVWKFVIENYLEGKNPSAFDVMYWTNDNTNLPSNMYLYYMRNMVLENKLRNKNTLNICNTPIDIGKIKIPVCLVSFTEDYISPAKTVFKTTEFVSGPVEFILGGSGHVMGTINPPSKNKYGYYLNGKLGNGFEHWKKTANHFDGSWWTPWGKKLAEKSGKKITASSILGNKKYQVIEPAPGKYVKEKCTDFQIKKMAIQVSKSNPREKSPVYLHDFVIENNSNN